MASTKKGIYSKDKIQEMILDKSLLNDYQKMVEERYALIGGISLIISAIVVGIPLLVSLYVSYKSYDNNQIDTVDFFVQIILIVLSALFLFIVVIMITGFIVGKISGRLITFKEYTEPTLLAYELALKRFEIENKIQDYEFMFENKEFFHGLHIIRDILKVRNMELDNQLAMIPIKQKNREDEVYQKLLERKLENERQYDWLGDQLNKLDK